MRTIIIMAANKKESKEIALTNYGPFCKYIKPYKYASKGNNFYQFSLPN